MQKKFIYVFSTEARDKLILENYQILMSDEERSIFVFENSSSSSITLFSLSEEEFVLSDTLIF